MKTKILFFTFILSFLSYGQNLIPNPSFENWQTETLTEYPEHWSSFKLSKTSPNWPEKIAGDAQDGNFSAKLVTVDDGEELSYSALFYGHLPGYNGYMNFTGVPLNQMVDKLHFWFKGESMPGDNGLIMVMLINDGNVYKQLIVPYDFTANEWTHGELEIDNEGIMPEEVFLGFGSSVADNMGGSPVVDSWVQLDNIYFTNGENQTPIYIENHSFEEWEDFQIEKLDGWDMITISEIYQGALSNIHKSTDANTGEYAVLLNKVHNGGDQSGGSIYFNSQLNFNPEYLIVNYKFESPTPETVMIEVDLKTNGVSQFFYLPLESNTDYEEVTFDLYSAETPDEITIQFFAGAMGTNLWIDDVDLKCQETVLPILVTICEGEVYTHNGIDYQESGIYYDTIWGENECDKFYEIHLEVNPSYSVTTEAEICEGQSYEWRGNSYTTTNIYQEDYITVEGCDSIFVLNLTVIPSDPVVLSEIICEGGSFEVQGHSFNTAGTHEFTYTTSSGCDIDYTVNLTVNPLPTNEVVLIFEEPSLTAFQPDATYQWLDCDNNSEPISGETGQTFFPTQTGNYAVEITLNGCSVISDCYNMTVAGIATEEFSSLILYPNPNQGNFTVNLGKTYNELAYMVTDLQGAIVYENSEKFVSELNLNLNVAKGIYLLKVSDGMAEKVMKISIE